MRNRTVAARETKLNVPGLRRSTETSASICKGPMVYKRVRGCDLRNWRRVWFSVCISNGKNLNILYFFHILRFSFWRAFFMLYFMTAEVHRYILYQIHFPSIFGPKDTFYTSTCWFHWIIFIYQYCCVSYLLLSVITIIDRPTSCVRSLIALLVGNYTREKK